jgi:hypothetical protein
MESRTIELVIAGTLLALSALTWLWLIPTYAGSGDQVLLPRFATAAIGLFAAMMLVGRLFLASTQSVDDDPFIERGRGEPMALLALVAVWTAFVLLIESVGFYLGGTAVLLASFVILGVRHVPAMLAWALATPFALWVVFEVAFSLRIPRGSLESWLLGLAG